MNWWVALSAAVATFLAVLVALFGQYLRAGLFPPKLRLSILDPLGSSARVKLSYAEGSTVKERSEDARYYHLLVANGRRWSPAHDVQVYLLQLEKPGPDGALNIVWTGEIPLNWRHQSVHPAVRTIGASADCDFISVVKGKWVELQPMIEPFNLEKRMKENGIFVATVQAKSREVDTPKVRIKVSWDGKWHDGKSEMGSHLVVQNVTGAA
jgi:hypothetical protein